MKRILLISGPRLREGLRSYANTFSEHIPDFEFIDADLSDIVLKIGPSTFEATYKNEPLEAYDLVMVRELSGDYLDLAHAVSRYLSHKDVPYFNHNYLGYDQFSKLVQAVTFHEAGVNFPLTHFVLQPEKLKALADKQPMPLIVKDAEGTKGDRNFLIQQPDELDKILAEHQGVKFILQEYCPNDGDYRVLVAGDQEPLQIKRQAVSHSHLNNTSKGAKADLVNELPTEIIKQAKDLAKVFNTSIAGLDVLKNNQNGQYYFLEINFQPQIVSGVFVDAKMKQLQGFFNSFFKSNG